MFGSIFLPIVYSTCKID